MRKKNSITIADIARKAGVSRTTVSFYLNQKFEKMSAKTRERIKGVIEETEFVPNALARSLNDKQSFLIGIVVQNDNKMEKAFFLDGVQDCLKENDYQSIVTFTGPDLEEERKAVEKMLALRVDGIIVNPTDSFDLLWNALGREVPLVAWNPPHASRYPMWVRSNDYEAVYDALEQQIAAGYSSFVMVTEKDGLLNSTPQRTLAFDHVMQQHRMNSRTLFIPASFTEQDLENQLMQTIRIERKTCFFVTAPSLLARVYRILQRYHELMPDHIGLLGFDSQEWAGMVSPSVTTLVQPSWEEGRKAAAIILDAISQTGQELPGQIFPCRLVQGKTTLEPPEELASSMREPD